MINSRNLADLHPAIKRGAEELLNRLENVLITSTYRDFEYQNYLYAQGRTRSGKIVTNAKAGQSIHNFKCAFDICKNIKGQEYSDSIFFKTAGRIWVEMGGEWGGDWKGFIDTPHFQFTNGLTLSQLQKGIVIPEDAKMRWEKNPSKENVYFVSAVDGLNIRETGNKEAKKVGKYPNNSEVEIFSILDGWGQTEKG